MRRWIGLASFLLLLLSTTLIDAPTTSAATATRSLTFVVQASDGTPGVDGCVSWYATDHSASSVSPKKTDSTGRATFEAVPITDINVSILACPTVGISAAHRAVWVGDGYGQGLSLGINGLTVPADGDLVVDVGPRRPVVAQQFEVRLPDGTPVPGAVISNIGQYMYSSGTRVWAACQDSDPTCPDLAWSTTPSYDVTSDALGRAHMWRFTDLDPSVPCVAHVDFKDQLLHQMTTADCAATGTSVASLPYLPVVRLDQAPAPVGYGAPVDIVATAEDESANPLADQKLTLTSTAAPSAAAVQAKSLSCVPVTTATTRPDGTAHFRLCPTSTGYWRVDGASIVASQPVKVQVFAVAPGAPTKLVVRFPKHAQSRVSWAAPLSTGGKPITKYQYSLNGGPWHGTGTTSGRPNRFVLLRSMKAGARYAIRVRAMNGIGAGPFARLGFHTPG